MVISPDLQAAPGWALEALARRTDEMDAVHDGVNVHYRCWNSEDLDKPGLLFVHGYRGHARWWDFIAPLFTADYRVYAMDLSGMGDSGHREGYTLMGHCLDIGAVIDHAGIAPATVVGHSYGGSRLLRLCGERPELVAHGVVMDSYVFVYDDDFAKPMRALGRSVAYASYEAARARFRLMPDQPAEPWALNYIAHHSLKPVVGGWNWKFDIGMGSGAPEPNGAEVLSRLRMPIDFAYGETSTVVDPRRAARIAALLPGQSTALVVHAAGHHMMLDQPLATIALLQGVLSRAN